MNFYQADRLSRENFIFHLPGGIEFSNLSDLPASRRFLAGVENENERRGFVKISKLNKFHDQKIPFFPATVLAQ